MAEKTALAETGPEDLRSCQDLDEDELKLIELAGHGVTLKQMGPLLDCSYKRVRKAWERVFKKLGVRSQKECIAIAGPRLAKTAGPRSVPASGTFRRKV
jgi:DNA-binding CsgD family transcriptional regulator